GPRTVVPQNPVIIFSVSIYTNPVPIADRFTDFFPEHERRDISVNPAIFGAPTGKSEIGRTAYPVRGAGNLFRIVKQRTYLPGNFFRMRPVIGIVNGNKFSLRRRKTFVTCHVRALIASQAQQSYSTVARGPSAYNGRC